MESNGGKKMVTSTMDISREVIVPKNQQEWLALRANDITSTEVSALFGLSPYTTLFELWHRKKEKTIVELEVNERMKWGLRLQDSIAEGSAIDNSWKVRRMDEYMRIPSMRMGSSFDFEIIENTRGLLEVKNVDALAFREGWLIDGDNVEAPPHIEIQVQHQIAVSGHDFAYIAALVGGNRIVYIKREPDQNVISSIKQRVAQFWLSIDKDQPPAPDFQRDSEFISRLYSYAEPGKIYNARGNKEIADLMEKYRAWQMAESTAGKNKDAIRAQILTIIGDAEKVQGDQFNISAGIVGECPVSYVRRAFRTFRPTFKKEGKEAQ
jgi:putative phage-type endonuclease